VVPILKLQQQEIDAMKQRLATAKSQATAASKSLTVSRETKQYAEVNMNIAKKMLDSANKDVLLSQNQYDTSQRVGADDRAVIDSGDGNKRKSIETQNSSLSDNLIITQTPSTDSTPAAEQEDQSDLDMNRETMKRPRSKDGIAAAVAYLQLLNNEYDTSVNDKDMGKDTNTSKSHQVNHSLPINIKEKIKVKMKAGEDEASTDDEYTPEGLVSWLIEYDPVKSEETDDEDTTEDLTNSSNKQRLPINVKAEVKTEDDISTDDENSNEMKDPVDPPAQSNSSIEEDESSQHTRKKKRSRSKRKREEVEESNRFVQKTARIECSVEGCTGKAADSGTCMKKHKGYKHCSQEGCTNRAKKGGVCIKHGAVVKNKICSHDGCKNKAVQGEVCMRHGAKRKTCKEEGCTNQVVNRGVCIRHGAVVKRKNCKEDGCTNYVQNRGLCYSHGAKKKTCKHEGCTNNS